MAISADAVFCFSNFELDPRAFELRRSGAPVRLERRPMDLLLLLLEHRGELVPRATIVTRLWEKDVFVDVDLGLNTAVRKVRQALGDDPRSPRFVETVPGRGYRFIGEVTLASKSAPAARRITLAVLPFENLGGDPEREYLADGLTEEAIAAIGTINPNELEVIGRTSITRYKRTAKALSEIGEELNAAYLVEGSVRSEGQRLRVTARLVATAGQTQQWSASYDSEPRSILSLQRELSAAIAQQVRMKLLPERVNALAGRLSQNLEAYDWYLRGRYNWNQAKPATTRQAVEYYRRATALDPNYALAWSGLADCYSTSTINGDAPPQQVATLAREAADHAIVSGPELAEPQTSLGFVNFFLDWNWNFAEQSFRRAIDLDRDNPLAHRMLGVVLTHAGRHEEAAQSLRRARELDPLYAMHHALSAMVAFHSGDNESAIDFARQAVVVDPQFWIGHYHLGQACAQAQKFDLAREALVSAERLSGGNSKAIGMRGYVLAKMGDTTGVQHIIQILDAAAQTRYVPPYAKALIRLGLDDTEGALSELECAYQRHDVHLIFLPCDPKWDPLRGHPKFVDLVRRCNFLPAQETP